MLPRPGEWSPPPPRLSDRVSSRARRGAERARGSWELYLLTVHIRTIHISVAQKLCVFAAEEHLGIGIKRHPFVNELYMIVMTVSQKKALNFTLTFGKTGKFAVFFSSLRRNGSINDKNTGRAGDYVHVGLERSVRDSYQPAFHSR